MKNIKNKKVIIGIVVAIIFLVAAIVLYFVINKDQITFNEKLSKIEYGEQYEYKDMVEKIESKETKVTYPKIKVSDLGTYEAVFQTNKNGNKREQTFKFKIVDTKKPKATLYVKNKDVEVSLNSEYNPIINIKKLENVSDGVIGNVAAVDKKEYSNLKKSIQDLNKQLKEQTFVVKGDKVTSNSKEVVKFVEENRNRIFYTTDIDTTKEGAYTLKMSIVDENFNVVENKWKVKVIPKGTLLNSGGTVTCKYTGNELNNTDAINVEMNENYRYDPYKVVTEYSASSVMTIKPDYQTKGNLDIVMNDMNQRFTSYINEKGVTVSVTNNGYTVTTSILINMREYDKKKDALDVMEIKNGDNVFMKTVLKKLEKESYVCEIN